MRAIRRVVMAVVFAVLAAVGVRLGGASNSAPQRGGWRPYDLPEGP